VLYEMVAGRAPFAGETNSDVIVSVLEREPPPLPGDVEASADTWRVISTPHLHLGVYAAGGRLTLGRY
jgi:hypothetical protein